ncbi:hypothetical protein CAPTEDRAFT_228636 [Capitella teleta]|uniref:Uncharacterized protein n=1 Tax=Capitella teleta TaxID=283909 RepID=R7VAE5_CAPTE|nr:hypothetical protein CAPTEDRAFT_228636 [Capitella teleta]|eukprot:ELU15512.1 hypothetical protein CAPTEDRAFT_228636 [Capitella teleta]
MDNYPSSVPGQAGVKNRGFSEEAKLELEAAYNSGLTSWESPTKKRKLEEIQNKHEGLTMLKIKNFITNKKRGKVVKVPGLKKTPYSEFLKAQHAKKDLPKGHGDAMTEISRRWSEARQDKNVCAALQESAEAAMAKPLTTQMKESKVKKLMRTISDKFDEIESLGGQAIFFLVRGNKTYLYGTKDVVKAPTFTPNIEKFSTDLLNHCSDESDAEQRKHGLVTQLQDMLNSKYSAFKRKSVRFSYKKLDDGDIRVVGLPEGVALKRPASLSSATIRKILSMSHLLHVEEVPKYPPPSASSTAITVPLLNADSNAHSITLPNDSELSVSLIHGNTIPPGQNVSQSVEPPSQNVSQSVEPPSQNVSQSVEPPSQNVSQSVEPPSQNVSQSVEPLSQNVSQSVEPLSQNVSQSVEPPSQNVSQSVEPPSTSKKIRRKRKENPTLQSGMKVQQLYRIHTESGTSTAWYHGCIKRVVKGDVSIRFDGEEAITKSKLSDIKAAMAEGTFLICK